MFRRYKDFGVTEAGCVLAFVTSLIFLMGVVQRIEDVARFTALGLHLLGIFGAAFAGWFLPPSRILAALLTQRDGATPPWVFVIRMNMATLVAYALHGLILWSSQIQQPWWAGMSIGLLIVMATIRTARSWSAGTRRLWESRKAIGE